MLKPRKLLSEESVAEAPAEDTEPEADVSGEASVDEASADDQSEDDAAPTTEEKTPAQISSESLKNLS